MIRRLDYSIHGIVDFSVKSKTCISRFDSIHHFYSYFRTSDEITPSITLTVGEFTPDSDDCVVLDNKYYVKDNYFYTRDRIGGQKWEVEVSGFDHGNARVNFHGYPGSMTGLVLPDFVPQSVILRPLVELKLLERGYSVIHGAGIQADEHNLVICGRGGAHKSELVSDAVRRRFRVFGDDRVIVSSKGEILSYPLFPSLIMRNAFSKEAISQSTFLRMGWMLATQRICQSNIDEIIADRGPLDSIAFLARQTGLDSLRQMEESVDYAERLVKSSQIEMTMGTNSRALESMPFLRYMQAYSYAYPESRIARYWETLKRTISPVLTSVPVFDFAVPETYSRTLLPSIWRSIFSEESEQWSLYS